MGRAGNGGLRGTPRRRDPIAMIRTILFFAYFWTTIVVASPICLLFLVAEWLGLGRWTRGALGACVRAWARSIMWASGAAVTVQGLEHVPASGRLCFVSNHQGDMDIVMTLAYLPRTVGFMAKSQAAWMPILNLWVAVLGSVFLDRGSLEKGKQSIDRGVRNIERGRALCIYPEGTRSRGPRMGPFRNGGFKLATRAGAMVVPITIDGAYRIWEATHRIVPSAVRFVVHPAIPTTDMGPDERRALPDRVRTIIESALTGL